MDACETFNSLSVDVLVVVFGIFEVGSLENIVKDFICVESAAEM